VILSTGKCTTKNVYAVVEKVRRFQYILRGCIGYTNCSRILSRYSWTTVVGSVSAKITIFVSVECYGYGPEIARKYSILPRMSALLYVYISRSVPVPIEMRADFDEDVLYTSRGKAKLNGPPNDDGKSEIAPIYRRAGGNLDATETRNRYSVGRTTYGRFSSEPHRVYCAQQVVPRAGRKRPDAVGDGLRD